MSDERTIVGVVEVEARDPSLPGKQFLGARLVEPDGTAWILDYDGSDYRDLQGKQVEVRGTPYTPSYRDQHLIAVAHLRVDSVREHAS